jgi:hypothetical protein
VVLPRTPLRALGAVARFGACEPNPSWLPCDDPRDCRATRELSEPDADDAALELPPLPSPDDADVAWVPQQPPHVHADDADEEQQLPWP